MVPIEERHVALKDLEGEEEEPVDAPELDIFFIGWFFECEVGEFGGNEDGEDGGYEARNTHDINNSKK